MIDHFLTQAIEVISFTASTSGTWGAEGAWTVSSTIQGRIRYAGGRERYASDKDTVLTLHRLYVNDSAGITEGNRVQYDGKVYDVKLVSRPTNADFLQVDIDYLQGTTAI
jgi:head-tail adaptor